jgi:hypothetical protein
LPTLDPVPESDIARVAVACSEPGALPWRTWPGRAQAGTRPRGGRLLRIVAVLIASTILAAAATHQFDQLSRPATPEWARACHAAIDANARLQQLRGVEIERAMQSTWATVAGLRAQTQPTQASNVARLQRNADDATQNCVSG